MRSLLLNLRLTCASWKNCYVRIIGSIKTFADKTHVLGIVIRLVEDKNEVLFHAVEAVHAHLGVTRGPVRHSLSSAPTDVPSLEELLRLSFDLAP